MLWFLPLTVTPTSVGSSNNKFKPTQTGVTWQDNDTNLIWQVKINKKEKRYSEFY